MNQGTNSDATGKLILRLAIGGLMLFHGVAKMVNPDFMTGIVKLVTAAGLPPQVAYGVYIGEVIAPVMILLGVLSRIGGLVVAINMGFAIVLAHTAQLFLLTKTGGWALELQGLYLLGALAIVFLGSGRFAVRPD